MGDHGHTGVNSTGLRQPCRPLGGQAAGLGLRAPSTGLRGRFRRSPPGQGHREEGAGRITPEPSASARTGSEASATTGCPRPPQPRALLAVSLLVFFLIFKGRTCRCETGRTKSGPRQGSRGGERPAGPQLAVGRRGRPAAPSCSPLGTAEPGGRVTRAPNCGPQSRRGRSLLRGQRVQRGSEGRGAPALPLLGCGVFAFR